MQEELTGTFEIGGKHYQCSVIDGICYIEGKTVDEFIDYLIEKGEFRALAEAFWLGNEIRKSK